MRNGRSVVALLAALLAGACVDLTGPEDGRVVVRLDGATCGVSTFTVDIFINGEQRATQTITAASPGEPIAVAPGRHAVSARVPNSPWVWAPLMATIPENGTYNYLLSCPTTSSW